MIMISPPWKKHLIVLSIVFVPYALLCIWLLRDMEQHKSAFLIELDYVPIIGVGIVVALFTVLSSLLIKRSIAASIGKKFAIYAISLILGVLALYDLFILFY